MSLVLEQLKASRYAKRRELAGIENDIQIEREKLCEFKMGERVRDSHGVVWVITRIDFFAGDHDLYRYLGRAVKKNGELASQEHHLFHAPFTRVTA